MSHMAALLEDTGAFIQMEDEIAAVSAIIGASWSGAKAMTATSGPGLSLMQEGIGYAYFTETPVVIVDVQRAGPATGQATHTAQGDVMQYKYGSHGDIYPIALAPWSVQEMYDLTIAAFNLAEQYRVPVFVSTDQSIAQARETMVLHSNFDIVHRRRDIDAPSFGSDAPDGVPPMPAFGDGARLLVTGSTHDENGFRRVDDPAAHDKLVTRLKNKTERHIRDIVTVDTERLDDAEIVFFAFGITGRAASRAVKLLRQAGTKAGLVRPKALWPFDAEGFRDLTANARHVVVPELNTGMMAGMLRSCVRAPVHSVTQTNGEPIYPHRLMEIVACLA